MTIDLALYLADLMAAETKLLLMILLVSEGLLVGIAAPLMVLVSSEEKRK